MKKIFKTFTQNILGRIGQFTLLVAGITIIWKVAVYFNQVNSNDKNVHNQLETIIETQSSQGSKLDSVIDTLYYLNQNVIDLKASHNALRSSYIKYLTKDSALTKADFISYMQGLELDLKKKLIEQDSIMYRRQLDSILLNLKIGVRKIDNNHGNKGQY